MRLAGLVFALAAAVLSAQQPDAGPPVRLHHFHLRSDDPAASMAEVIDAAGGTRAIASGLGAGVRVGDVYVLFDRSDERPPKQPASPRGTFERAVRWLEAHHVEVRPGDASAALLTSAFADRPEAIDHIAFAADDPARVEQSLRAAGAAPAHRIGQSSFYRTGDGLIEITADTERPDRYWCPMHPQVRAADPQTCPICSMALVPISPSRFGEYRLEVTQVPSRRGGGVRALQLRVRDPDTHQDVAMFAESHERLFHLFIVGRDLQYFAHEHPQRTVDGFELPVDLPAGAYMLIADFLPGGGSPQMLHRAIVTPGYRASPFGGVALNEDLAEKLVGGLRVQLHVDPRPGRPAATLRFRIADASGSAVTDLEPYLGSAGHLLVVSPDLTHSIHAHPEGRTSGPELAFDVEFPEAGIYKLWLQVQRAGAVVAVPFVVGIAGA